MKHIIVGTAGHIDHGKTTLIKALTGRNTDRWKEEQERGITIDLGFTWFDMKNGDRVGIIDVPGHEKFIANMVAGVVGMDLVMLVVAADEGIMPQTREHMDILSLLGIEKSIVVINKCDLVDEEWLMMMEEEIKEELSDTFLKDAPVVKVSAATGDGIEELCDTLIRLTSDEVEARDVKTIPRLPVDRVFTLSGFGTIITGTLISGTITKEDVLEMYPVHKECRIRSIQVHGKDADVCEAGQRVAINISNVKKEEIKRGCVLAPVGNMKNTDLLDVKVTMLKGGNRVLNNRARLHLYTGTSEVLCRAVILDKEELLPGEEGLCQLWLEEEVAVKRGDRFVIRFYSPMETIGGGVILETNPRRKKRFDEKGIEELSQKEGGSLSDLCLLHINEAGNKMITLDELAKIMAHPASELTECIDELEENKSIYVFRMKKDVWLLSADSEAVLRADIIKGLTKYHEDNPYQNGRKKAEVHSTYLKTTKPNVFDAYVEMLVSNDYIGRNNEYLCVKDFKVNKDDKYQKIEKTLMDAITTAGYDFLRFNEIDLKDIDIKSAEDVINQLIDEGAITRVSEECFTLTSLVDDATVKIKDILDRDKLITIAQTRDMFETSRKSAKILIEYMDEIKITKKVGGEAERVPY